MPFGSILQDAEGGLGSRRSNKPDCRSGVRVVCAFHCGDDAGGPLLISSYSDIEAEFTRPRRLNVRALQARYANIAFNVPSTLIEDFHHGI